MLVGGILLCAASSDEARTAVRGAKGLRQGLRLLVDGPIASPQRRSGLGGVGRRHFVEQPQQPLARRRARRRLGRLGQQRRRSHRPTPCPSHRPSPCASHRPGSGIDLVNLGINLGAILKRQVRGKGAVVRVQPVRR